MTYSPLCRLIALCLAALPLTATGDTGKDRLGLDKAAEGEMVSKSTPERWTCIIGSAKEAVVMVRLDAIVSISKQTYMLEGSQKIREVTIDTEGSNSIRFYSLCAEKANRMLERTAGTRALIDRQTENATRYPSKKYPEGTHSHNIEYQLSTPEQLDAIYESACHSWVKKAPVVLTVKG